MKTPLRRRRELTALLTVALALVASIVGVASADERTGIYPGLPFIECPDELPPSDYDPCSTPDFANRYGWINGVSLGRTGSPKAKQWARIPLMTMGNNILIGNRVDGEDREYTIDIRTFLVSPKGSDRNYGRSPLIPVRTVAFGSIPVEVTLQLQQRLDADGYPVPFYLRSVENVTAEDGGRRTKVEPAALAADVDVQIRSLKVDGNDVGLDDSCGTGTRSRLSVTSKPLDVLEEPGYVGPSFFGKSFDTFDPAEAFYGLYGGTLEGSIDIASLEGCSTRSGDDVSPVLTAALSGPGNPVTLQVGSFNCVKYTDDFSMALPPRPGATTPEEIGCAQNYYETPDESVTNPRVRTVPRPLDFPDEAPRHVE